MLSPLNTQSQLGLPVFAGEASDGLLALHDSNPEFLEKQVKQLINATAANHSIQTQIGLTSSEYGAYGVIATKLGTGTK